MEVSGAKTEAIFDDVFSKMVAAAQPIPGFRREKGGEIREISTSDFSWNYRISFHLVNQVALEVTFLNQVLFLFASVGYSIK